MKYTRQDFVRTAELIKSLPPRKRADAFGEWVNVYSNDNPRFDAGRFAEACNVKMRVIEYTPEPAEVIPDIPTGLNHLRFVTTDREHQDVFLNDEKIGYIYDSRVVHDCQFNADRESRWYPLVRHIYAGGYTETYRLCNIFNAYTLNSDRTISVDCTGQYLGYIVIRPNGLTTSEVPGQYAVYDVYENFKKVRIRRCGFSEYVGEDKGLFIKEQMGVLYPQVAITHATVWINKRDALKIAKRCKGKVVPLIKFQNPSLKWEKRSEDYRMKERAKEFEIATKNLRK